jgi:hypothetical protein
VVGRPKECSLAIRPVPIGGRLEQRPDIGAARPHARSARAAGGFQKFYTEAGTTPNVVRSKWAACREINQP